MTRKLFLLLFLQLSLYESFSQADSNINKINKAISDSLSRPDIYKGVNIQEGFKKYNGTITAISETDFKYDEITLTTFVFKSEYNILFEKGILYPGILAGVNTGGAWEKIKPDTFRLGTILFDPSRFSISIYEELKLKKPSFTIKRILFWRFTTDSANSTEFIMDLENDSATETTDLKTFLQGCKITHIRSNGIII